MTRCRPRPGDDLWWGFQDEDGVEGLCSQKSGAGGAGRVVVVLPELACQDVKIESKQTEAARYGLGDGSCSAV